MKWIARRIFLESPLDPETAQVEASSLMETALLQLVIPFIEKVTTEDGITEWYCSRKTDTNWRNPSVRIYLRVNEENELSVLSKLDVLVRENKNDIRWMRTEIEVDVPDGTESYLKSIQKASEIALGLLKNYPGKNRDTYYLQFCTDLTKTIHFLSNNLDLQDMIYIGPSQIVLL